MLKRSRKQLSFLEEPEMKLLNAAAQKAEEDILKMSSLLEGQENNLTLNQAEELAIKEQRHIIEETDHLISIYRDKMRLLDAKVKLIEEKERLVTSSSLTRKTIDTLRPLKPAMGNVPPRPNFEATLDFDNDDDKSRIDIPTPARVMSAYKTMPQRPVFSSMLGQQLVPVPTTADNKTNEICKNVLNSGGSSLDGSFHQTGVTYEEIMRPPRSVIGNIPLQPNFDATLDFDNDDKSRVDIPTPVRAPPFIVPLRQTTNLGTIPNSTPRAFKLLPQQVPQRPVFSSMLGQQLNQH